MLCRVAAATVLSLVAIPSRAQSSPVLEIATARAVAYQASALKWTCEETVQRFRFNDRGDASKKSDLRFELQMTPDADARPAEVAAPVGSRGHSAARSKLEGFPPLTEWLRLFHPDVLPWMLIRDGGPDTPEDPGHRFFFRGAFARAHGDDIREWEGIAWVNPRTGDLMQIEATPVAQDELLAAQVDRRNALGVAVDLFGLRLSIGPKARGRRLGVTFGPQAGGFWLPKTARLELFDAESKRSERPLRAAVVSVSRCGEVEGSAVP